MRVLKAYACGAPIIHVGTNRDCIPVDERAAINLKIVQRCQQEQIDVLHTIVFELENSLNTESIIEWCRGPTAHTAT